MAILVDILVIGAWIIFGSVVWTQIAQPTMRNTALFPMFRRKIRRAQRELKNIHEQRYEQEVTDQTEKVRREQFDEMLKRRTERADREYNIKS